MLAEKDIINKENTSYAAAGPNGNTVVTPLLQAAGLPQPKNNGLDGVTPAPRADMSLLGHHYSPDYGYDELVANAGTRGLRDVEYGIGAAMRDIGDDVGGAIREFRRAFKAVAGTESAGTGRLGLYEVAVAAGRPGLGGFAPVAGAAGRPVSQKSRAAVPLGEVGFLATGQGGVSADIGAQVARHGGSAETSYRAVVAQARREAAAGRARREADAAARHLPARGTALAGRSFAPPAAGGAAGGSSLQPAVAGPAGVAGLRRWNSMHEAVPEADAASTDNGEAESLAFVAGTEPATARVAPADIERAMENYFFRQSRLPPVGGAAFNPLLSPVWAGLKIPG